MLLIVAAAQNAWPWPLRTLLVVAVLAHAAARRPRRPPALLVVGEDGSWRVPEWGGDTQLLAERTTLTRFALDLHLGIGPGRRHVLLLVDQLERTEWTRLNAILRRAVAQV